MIDHITVGIARFQGSTSFYDKAFQPLGLTRLAMEPTEPSGGGLVAGFGDGPPSFWIAEADAHKSNLHIALAAKTRAAVNAFSAAEMAAGAVDNGPPELRPEYDKHDDGALVLDPNGHNIEAVCRTANA